MSKNHFTTLAVLALALATGTYAQEESKTNADKDAKAPAIPNLLAEAIDPYISGKERARFLKAAGVDTELDADEFNANAASKNPFARKFDKWSYLLLFDRNKDAKLDWFEANGYRLALRQAIFDKYDTNGDRKLTGKERDKANKDLARGLAPKPSTTATGTGRRPGPFDVPDPNDQQQARKQLEENWRKGELTEDQRVKSAADILKGRKDQVAKWDSNGDGILDEAERASAKASDDGKWWLKFDDLGMKHFDEDGDGRLSEAESRAMVRFGEKTAKMMSTWDVTLWDNDGDGQVSDEERKASERRLQFVGAMLLPKAMQWGDADGDGQTTDAEWRMMADRVDKISEQQFDKWNRRFDADGNGRLNIKEREALIEGMNEDMAARYKRHDKDGDGKLSNAELAAMGEELAAEWGVKPPDK